MNLLEVAHRESLLFAWYWTELVDFRSKFDSPQIIQLLIISAFEASSKKILLLDMAEGLLVWKLNFHLFLADLL